MSEIYFRNKNFKYKILNLLYFGPNFIFCGDCFRAFQSLFFFFYFSLLANHGGLYYCSSLLSPRPPYTHTIKKPPMALVSWSFRPILCGVGIYDMKFNIIDRFFFLLKYLRTLYHGKNSDFRFSRMVKQIKGKLKLSIKVMHVKISKKILLPFYSYATIKPIKHPETVVRSYSVKDMFFKILKNSQKFTD